MGFEQETDHLEDKIAKERLAAQKPPVAADGTALEPFTWAGITERGRGQKPVASWTVTPGLKEK